MRQSAGNKYIFTRFIFRRTLKTIRLMRLGAKFRGESENRTKNSLAKVVFVTELFQMFIHYLYKAVRKVESITSFSY